MNQAQHDLRFERLLANAAVDIEPYSNEVWALLQTAAEEPCYSRAEFDAVAHYCGLDTRDATHRAIIAAAWREYLSMGSEV